MSEEQLRALGEKLSIKNAKKLSMEELGFAILDEEARIESQKPVEEKTRTKRGRPAKKKEEKPKQEAPAEPVKDGQIVALVNLHPLCNRASGKAFRQKAFKEAGGPFCRECVFLKRKTALCVWLMPQG